MNSPNEIAIQSITRSEKNANNTNTKVSAPTGYTVSYTKANPYTSYYDVPTYIPVEMTRKTSNT